MRDLLGKIALVTGASRGIGRAIAERLAGEGALVAVHYRADHAAAAQTLAAIEGEGGAGFTLQADLGQSDGVATLLAAFAAALQQRGQEVALDILVNNAGMPSRKPIEQVSEAEFDTLLHLDLKAPFFLIQRALPLLRDQGRIINISSTASRIAYADMPLYAAAKAALDALTRSLARQLGPRGITVNAVAPGATATDLNPAATDPATAQQIAATTLLGRIGRPDDVAELVGFLASERGRWITGQRIEASGGLLL